MTTPNLTPSRLIAARRQFLLSAGFAGLAALGAGSPLFAQQADPSNNGLRRRRSRSRDADILNFALNLEYLEAEYYLRAVGRTLAAADTTGEGTLGGVTGGSAVTFTTQAIRDYANEIAADEEAHVKVLRGALGEKAVARPAIDLVASFTAAAQAAGLIPAGQTFNPFESERSFLLGAFLFEDVGVTAYAGAAPLLLTPGLVGAAAQILAVEAYHAGLVRTTLFALSRATGGSVVADAANMISDARDSLDGTDDLDQGIATPVTGGNAGEVIANIVPTDANGLVFTRTPSQVLNIVYLNPNAAPGGFFPQGLNGQIR